MQRSRKIVTAGLVLASAAGGYVLSSMTQRAGAQTAIVNRGDGRGWCAVELGEDSGPPPRLVGISASDAVIIRAWSDGRIEAFDNYPNVSGGQAGRWTGWRVVE